MSEVLSSNIMYIKNYLSDILLMLGDRNYKAVSGRLLQSSGSINIMRLNLSIVAEMGLIMDKK